jgi:hypothetical protein
LAALSAHRTGLYLHLDLVESSQFLTYPAYTLVEGQPSTVRLLRNLAADGSKSLELEARIGRLELLVRGLQDELAMRQRHEVSLQAQLDHLLARVKLNGV